MNKSCVLICAALILLAGCMEDLATESVLFYTGCSNSNLSHPIYLCKLDYTDYSISVKDSFPGTKGSSYLSLTKDKMFLYAIDKSIHESNSGNQMVSSFRVDKSDYGLEYLNSQSSEGKGPCHVFCNSDRSYLFTANYGSGILAAFPLAENGEVLPASDIVINRGSGPNKSRQSAAHAHYVCLDPDENYLISPDLGADRVFIFRFDKSKGELIPNPDQAFFKSAPGAGPRHLTFHPEGKYLYIVNELNTTVTACSFNSSTGEITRISTVSTLPEHYDKPATCAAIRVHPNGKFLYASNRGDNSSIAIFSILDNGSIDRIQVLEGVPYWPRDFNIDPEGKCMLVAGERGDEIEVYEIDPDNGMLDRTGNSLGLNSPANILFIPSG